MLDTLPRLQRLAGVGFTIEASRGNDRTADARTGRDGGDGLLSSGVWSTSCSLEMARGSPGSSSWARKALRDAARMLLRFLCIGQAELRRIARSSGVEACSVARVDSLKVGNSCGSEGLNSASVSRPRLSRRCEVESRMRPLAALTCCIICAESALAASSSATRASTNARGCCWEGVLCVVPTASKLRTLGETSVRELFRLGLGATAFGSGAEWAACFLSTMACKRDNESVRQPLRASSKTASRLSLRQERSALERRAAMIVLADVFWCDAPKTAVQLRAGFTTNFVVVDLQSDLEGQS
jgi:hypothetical protein